MKSKNSSQLSLGLLAPSSNFVPFLADDMLAAFSYGLKQADLDAEVLTEFTGFNADLKTVTPVIQQLLLSRRVDLIIAPFNISLIEKVSGLFESQNTPLVALNLTEDPLFESSRNSFVFINNECLWHDAWMSGYLAGKRFGQRGGAAVGLHEGGYGLMFAFQLGLEAAQGTLVHAAVTHRNASNEDPSEALAEIASQKPDFIWAAYSGKEAVSFLEAYHSSNLKNDIPVITIPSMVSEHIRKTAGEAISGIFYTTSKNYEGDEKKAFDELTIVIGRLPNPYALLAYEAAHLIADTIRKTNDTSDLIEALRHAEFKSPRGLIRFNRDFDSVDYYLRMIDGTDTLIEKITVPALIKEQYELACKKLVKGGWVNPYLCA